MTDISTDRHPRPLGIGPEPEPGVLGRRLGPLSPAGQAQCSPRKTAIGGADMWHAQLDGSTSCAGETKPCAAMLRRFRGIAPDIDQPPLRENLLAIHLGGAKRVTRLQGRNREVHDVERDSVTVMPALTPGRWSTQGPVDFAHLTLSPGLLRQVAVEEFDREPRDLQLIDRVGHRDTLIEACFGALLSDMERPRPGRLYREGLLAAISFKLVQHYSTLSPGLRSPTRASSTPLAKGGLASWQVRRVVDYMHANLACDISINGELVQLTGLSRAQFFRAFGQSFGCSPNAYLGQLRVRQAMQLLQATDMTVSLVAAAVGLSTAQLTEGFRRSFHTSPTRYRRTARRS